MRKGFALAKRENGRLRAVSFCPGIVEENEPARERESPAALKLDSRVTLNAAGDLRARLFLSAVP